MSAKSKAVDNAQKAIVNDEQVRQYLREHSDFFERNPDMLDHIHIPHNSGSAVSLVEKQLSVLRERNIDLRQRLKSLTDNARDNNQLYDWTHGLILSLLEARNQDELGRAFAKAMQDDFSVEHASLIVFGDPKHSSDSLRIDSIDTAHIEIDALLKNRKPTCGVLRKKELAYLFPGTSDIGSAAVVPLITGNELGVLAVGSGDASYYSSSMGTLFLNHIADVLVRLLPKMTRADL